MNEDFKRNIYILIISLILFLHAALYPPNVIIMRIIEIIVATILFIYSITKMVGEISG